MQSPPQITCSCKVARCATCLECSRCGCGHDGVTPERKVSRKRGQRGEAIVRTNKNPKRTANKYKPGALFESPMLVAPRGKPRPDTNSESIAPISNPDFSTTMCENVGDILRAVGFSNNVDYVYRHLPSLAKRVDPQTWSSSEPDQSVAFTKRALSDIIQRACELFCGNSAEASTALMDSLQRGNKSDVNITSQDTMQLVAGLYSCASKGSTEKRVLRALMCTSSRAGLSDLKQQVPGLSLSCDSFSAGRRDMNLLKAGHKLSIASRSLQRFERKTVEDAVAYILSAENVSFLSWGTKRVLLDGRIEQIPAIQRKKSRTHIYEAYSEKSISSHASAQPLSRAAFFRVISAITAGDARLRKAVDYVVGFLINDSFEVLGRILLGLRVHESVREAMLAKLETTRAYLKYGFDFRVKSGDASCLLHEIKFGLDPASVVSEVVGVCSDCQNAFQLFDMLTNQLVSDDADVSTQMVVGECRSKAILFMGHRLRVVNQQEEIAKVLDGIRDRCVVDKNSSEAVVTLDFKMKLDPIYFREKTVEHYGKRGISWHGAMIQHWLYDNGVDVASPPAAVEQKLYFDHISNGDNKQDREAVISIMEAILIRIKKDLPHIKKIVVLFDNATCYQNMLLPLVFPLLGHVHGIEIVRLVHTETQDGKGVLDSHFARSMQVLIAWVREGNNCITPTQTVIGLKSHGGLPNSVVELVEHDRSSLQKLVTDAEQMEKQLRACVSRANEVQVSCSATSSPVNRKGNVKYSQCPDFELKVFAASGVGSGTSFRCSPSRNVCRVLHSSSNEFDGANRDEEREQEEDECHPGEADDWDSMSLQDSSDSDSDESQTEVIEMSVTTGLVTGVRIATQGQIRRRTLRWRHKPRQNDHSQAEVRSRDVVSFAVRSAILMHSAGEVFVLDRASLYGRQRSSQEFVLPQAFNSGWAVRPKRGSLYGKRYIESFRDDIKSLFMEGERSAASKMGPGRILEMLRIKYPERYDLPTENEVRQEITKLKIQTSQRLLEGGKPTAFDVSSGGDGCQAALSRFVEEDPTIKPRAALARFRAEVPNSLLTDTQIKTKVSYIKSRVKAKAFKVEETTR